MSSRIKGEDGNALVVVEIMTPKVEPPPYSQVTQVSGVNVEVDTMLTPRVAQNRSWF
jgi:hypothetical protein